MMRRRWMGDRSLSLCGGGFCWGLGLLWPPEEAPQRAQWGLVTPELVEEAEKEEDRKHRRVRHFHIQPPHRREVSPGHPPP